MVKNFNKKLTALFSYTDGFYYGYDKYKGTDNTICFGIYKDNEILFNLFNKEYRIKTNSKFDTNKKYNFKISVDSTTGIVKIYLDNSYVGQIQDDLFKKSRVNNSGWLFLGQDQDSYGGKLDSEQALYGTISNLNIWDSALTDEEIKEPKTCKFPTLSWEFGNNYSDNNGNNEFTTSNIYKCRDGEFSAPLSFAGNDKSYAKTFVDDFPTNELTIHATVSSKELTNDRYFFSFANEKSDFNTLLLGNANSNKGWTIYNSNKSITNINKPLQLDRQYDIIYQLNRSTKQEKFYIDGVLVSNKTLTNLPSISKKGCIILGQDQNTYGGGFESIQSWKGNLYNLEIYNKIIDEEIISNGDFTSEKQSLYAKYNFGTKKYNVYDKEYILKNEVGDYANFTLYNLFYQ